MVNRGGSMRNLTVLFEYQKFNPNTSLEKKIADVHSRYSKDGEELADEDMDLSAAGECMSDKREWGKVIDDKK